ncbi:nuclear transport factor 2 family protein [Chryseobacterium sp. JK1]|uniref:nuclear transport factor 2 family protein n=1 Tax=Chryseobacterium sp. JK1 TaxID=874294 RepID=UPI003D68BAD9
MNNKELIVKAITAVFVDRDITAFDQYFGDHYIQHNPTIPNGTEALKQFIPYLPDDFGYEPGVVTENGDIVMIHGRYKNWNGKNMIGVDIFRVHNGKITEHWDVLQEEVTAENSVNENEMFPILLT